ncbi:hypothetical protein FSP39_021075 [Pinctada imbricata]|uniref:Branched-chain amino acid transport system carrier protein n=1 Tax=Pinctada imbricata TaxID=66713 RepID=A0AA89BY13_PINIB|nr:hypothetical protein FSP39_021075 [Pinctada imbricata]
MIAGILTAFLCSQILGVTWYSPPVLGGPWMTATFPGKTFDQIGEGMLPMTYLVSMIAYACLAVLVNVIISQYAKVSSYKEAVQYGMVFSLIITATSLPHCMFSQRSPITAMVDHGFDFVVVISMCMCAVLFGQGKDKKKIA